MSKVSNEWFLLENPIWKVELSNKEIIISDNEYIDNFSDWERLKKYILSNKLFINKMWISFRDNIIQISEAKYYYFRRMVLGSFGNDKSKNYFIVGSSNNPEFVHIKKYLVPEMSCVEEEDRILEPNEISLI